MLSFHISQEQTKAKTLIAYAKTYVERSSLKETNMKVAPAKATKE